MPVEPNTTSRKSHLPLSLFALEMSVRHPALWALFVAACARERVAATNNAHKFIRRCTRAARAVRRFNVRHTV